MSNNDLVWLWIGLRLLGLETVQNKRMEIVREDYFNNLVSHCFFHEIMFMRRTQWMLSVDFPIDPLGTTPIISKLLILKTITRDNLASTSQDPRVHNQVPQYKASASASDQCQELEVGTVLIL
ncbi:hypothetical protein Dimus_023847 [Dionaea muscipula]